ncbi:MAG: glutamine amidotransferase [Candidatus Hinthialibacter sp.]
MKKIFYIGDWAVQIGPVFAETSFNHVPKGLDIFNYGHWLKDALESTGDYEVVSVPTWEFYKMPPGRYEEILDAYDAVIFSDVEAKNFQLAPDFFDRKKFGRKPLTFPDRINLTLDAVHQGMTVLFLGGWLSFNGEMGKGGWGRTRLREILPVQCLDYEDLCESTEGFTGVAADPGHPLFTGVDLGAIPPVLGYNRVKPRENCPVLAHWSGAKDPMIAYGDFEKGRVLCYTSDPAPHWGCNFVYWDDYNQFWINAINWALRRDSR